MLGIIKIIDEKETHIQKNKNRANKQTKIEKNKGGQKL